MTSQTKSIFTIRFSGQISQTIINLENYKIMAVDEASVKKSKVMFDAYCLYLQNWLAEYSDHITSSLNLDPLAMEPIVLSLDSQDQQVATMETMLDMINIINVALNAAISKTDTDYNEEIKSEILKLLSELISSIRIYLNNYHRYLTEKLLDLGVIASQDDSK